MSYYNLPHSLRRNIYRLTSQKSFSKLQKERCSSTGKFRGFDEKRAIFFHIPKCAGTSIASAVFGYDKVSHRDAKKYQQIFSEQDFNAYFKFTVVRNPYDRLISAYTYLKNGGGTTGDQNWAIKHLSHYENFEDFVFSGLNKPHIINYHHFRPQYKYICLPGKTEPVVDYIGKLENLAEVESVLSEKLNLSELGINKKNTSKRGDYKSYYSPESIKRVADIYKIDLELLNYTFEH